MRISHTIPGVWPPSLPGRFAQLFRGEPSADCRLALLGLPDDLGVKLNLGRPGARGGPAALRAALASFGASYDARREVALSSPIFDAGDVAAAPGEDAAALLETHERVKRAAHELHERGLTVIAVGGGHDLSLPTIEACANAAGGPLGGINVDAHLDVRERVGSGMPFRRLIERNALEPRRFVEVGLNRFANEQTDFEWLKARGAELVLVDDVLRDGVAPVRYFQSALAAGPGFLSVDLDVLDSSIAPGVSAKNPLGLRLEHVAELVEHAGTLPEVRHFDLMELSPPHDVDGRTARVAAYLLLAFVAGFGRRPA